MESGKRVVTMGGGTGPFALLSRLKSYPCDTTAIVTMSDSGGSSRRLMDEFGQLPFGDLRQSLVALSRKADFWRDIFTFRFDPSRSNGGGVGGHSMGNLIISALQTMNGGDLLQAIQDAQELLDTAGTVLPVTLSRATLCADLEDGTVICGETEIDTRGKREPGPLPPIRRVFLSGDPLPCAEALEAIRRADVIVLGPGDLYTSVLPNLLVEGIARAVAASPAEKVYVCNLMTKHGETDGFRASDFVREIHLYLGQRVDRVIVHDGSTPDHLLRHYAAERQHPVAADVASLKSLVPDVVVDQLVDLHGGRLVRHDADRLLQAIFAPSISRTSVSA